MGFNLKVKPNLRIIWLLLFTVATFCDLYGQEPKSQGDEIDALLDDLFFNEDQLLMDVLDLYGAKDFIYASTRYNSNTYFSGRDSGVDQFNIVPQVTYFHSSGFNLSLSGVLYQEFDPNWDFTNISIAYFKRFGKKKQFHFSGGYTRYIYSDGWDIFTNSADIGLGFRTKSKKFGTELSGSLLFGGDESFQLVSNTYLNIPISQTKGYTLKLRPQINFIVAQQTIALQQLNTIDGETTIDYIYNDVFDLLNTQLTIPLALVTKAWDFQLGYAINFPNPVATESNLDSTSFMFFSVGYLFDLD